MRSDEFPGKDMLLEIRGERLEVREKESEVSEVSEWIGGRSQVVTWTGGHIGPPLPRVTRL